MKIVKLASSNEVLEILNMFDEQFNPRISQKVCSLENYAQKLIDRGQVYIGYISEVVVGFYSIYINEEYVYISLIAINESYRGKGLGRQFIQSIVELAVKSKKNTIYLEVDGNNSIAENFYIKNGFIDFKQASEKSKYMIKKWE